MTYKYFLCRLILLNVFIDCANHLITYFIFVVEFITSLIIKRQIACKSRRELFRCDEAFANEIVAYCQLVPVLKKFCKDSIPVPMCLFAGTDSLGDIVVLEDLSRQGFKMRNRLKGLDFEHLRVVLKVSFCFCFYFI